MGVPLNFLTQSQRFWYAQMIVAAILADDEITKPETEYIKQILPIVKRPEDRTELINRIAAKNPPPIVRPAGVAPKVLAAVFVEMVLVMISDVDFSQKERQFLNEVARVFRFTPDYVKDLLAWCEEGLEWKHRQSEFVAASGSGDVLKVPVGKLNPLQQRWYAETLIASIMCDQQLDQAEVRFLKGAINLIKDETHRREVTALVRKNTPPVITNPPNIPKNYLVRIFIEVMLIISADESLAKKEHTFLQNLALKCEFSENLFNRLIGWCIQGIKWKRAKNPLINRCAILLPKTKSAFQVIKADTNSKADDTYLLRSEDKSGEPVSKITANEPVETNLAADNPDNNSITDFNMDCYVCNSRLSVKFFQLKEESQQPRHNIFGIPIYRYAAEGFDPVDYNQCKVAVCHTCFFASPQKEMFKLREEDQPPKQLNLSEFQQRWLRDIPTNQKQLQEYLGEFGTIHRSIPAVAASYEMAIKASTLLAEMNKSHEIAWHTTTLKLTLAQVLMANQRNDQADALLKQIQQRSMELFNSVKNHFITFRSGRLILLIALYFEEAELAAKYFDFFNRFKEQHFKSLAKDHQILFQRVYGEIKRIMENPARYSKIALNGYLLQENK